MTSPKNYVVRNKYIHKCLFLTMNIVYILKNNAEYSLIYPIHWFSVLQSMRNTGEEKNNL